VLLGFAGFGAGLLALRGKGLLSAPPLAATYCIDSKFRDMRGAPLGDRTLVAVGSSATWRNLDMPAFERRFPDTRAYNAAPCFLHADQTAYLAEFLLERMPRVRTVVTVVAPRDFESCPPQDTAFFDPDLARGYLSGGLPGWVLRIAGFRPLHLVRDALRLRRESEEGPGRTHDDGHGSSILQYRQEWRPPLRIDDRCYAGLARLEAAAAKAGARLAVVAFPVMPEWAAVFDPDGTGVEEWVRDTAASLRLDTSLLIDGRALAWDDSRFADPVHLLYPHHRPFTRFILDEMARRWPAAATAGRG
jgi:hypothetical protein